MKLINAIISMGLAVSASSLFAADCTKDEAKAAVEKACDLVKAKGKDAVEEIQKFRFCDSNYVWIQDKDVKMVMHPIKPRLNGNSLTEHKDEKGTHLFVEFDKMAKSTAEGGWVDYMWAKPGAEQATPKTSFVKKCEGGLDWIAGSGVWK